MNATVPTLDQIRRTLSVHQPALLPVDRPHAAVALLLAEGDSGPEALFILRARHPGDPWSGDMGFPGGRAAPDDRDPRATAERESREELGLALQEAEYLGRLDDLYGATLSILVSCFVYAAPARPALQPNHEVESTLWLPLEHLLDPQRHCIEEFTYRGALTRQPVADLLGPDAPRLWGITYRLLRSFFALLDRPFGPPPA